jgi:SAM-dependent methyltransferase
VSGVDITEPFVEAANKLTALLRMERQVKIERGDGQRLPYPDSSFDGAYAQHVTMNVADRPAFFAEAYRVPGCRNDCRDRSLDLPARLAPWVDDHRPREPRAPPSTPGPPAVRGPTTPVTLGPNLLGHFLILNEAHLRRLLRSYIGYYNTAQTHQSLDNHSPQPRRVEPPPCGRIVAIPQVGGLHHRSQRVA